LVLQEFRDSWQCIQCCWHQHMKNVQIQAYNTSKLIKDSLQGPLNSVNIASMIHRGQSTLKNTPTMYEILCLIQKTLNMSVYRIFYLKKIQVQLSLFCNWSTLTYTSRKTVTKSTKHQQIFVEVGIVSSVLTDFC